MGAFSPSFVQGEINLANKNAGKIRNCGFDPMKTCLLSSIKPEEMRDADLLWEFCQEIAPVSNVKLNETGSTAFIECGPDPDVGEHTVHPMPRNPPQQNTLEGGRKRA